MPVDTQLQESKRVDASVVRRDYIAEAVPLHERRDSLTMGLLWITMVTGFPSVLAGFEWFKEGLFHLNVPLVLLSAGLAFVMAFNNFFGFNGVANFARYLAGPVLVLWVGYTFIKAGASCPPQLWTEPSHASYPLALGLVSTFVIGYSVWGNEADYWRFGKPKLFHVTAPIIVALAIGELLFPVTGWMLARTTGITDYASATALMNNYAFGGFSVVAAAVLAVTYFALNDSSLYGAVNALQNVHPIPRRRMVALLSILGAVTAAALSGVSKIFEDIASLSCIFLPSATIVIVAEGWLISKWHRVEGELSRVPSFAELPPVRWSAIAAFAIGCSVGVATTGLIPGTESLKIGVPALQAWVTTLIAYMILRHVDRDADSRPADQMDLSKSN